MKPFALTTLIVFSCLLSKAQSDSSKLDNTKLLLEKGHIINLVLARDIGSSVAQAGNKVYLEVDSAVVLSGTTVIPKGAKAYGTITNVKERRGAGQAGTFAFSIDKLLLDNGREIALTANHTASGRSTAEAAIVESILLSPLFVFKKGKDVTYKEGKPFIAFTAYDNTF